MGKGTKYRDRKEMVALAGQRQMNRQIRRNGREI